MTRDILCLLILKRNMKYWSNNFYIGHNNSFYRICAPLRTNKLLGATVITNIFSAIPYLGTQLVEWLWREFAVSGPTLNRFFVLHFLLPFSILLIVALPLLILHETGSNNPLGLNSNCERIPFHQYFTLKDIIGLVIRVILLIFIILFIPNYLSDPENFIEANPLTTPTHIQPEWYFLWLYAILRSIPNKLGGVIALLSAIFILYLPPIYNNNCPLSFCPIAQLKFFIILQSWLILRWIGRCPVETPFIEIGQIFTILYFSYFLLIPKLLNKWNITIN